ncbi:MAG: helix-turn-helix domain-containing protein [Acetobacteraceae bacterium]|nr:helix-turn-helix domain-containing protein [Acetobacteraceae bacterium]
MLIGYLNLPIQDLAGGVSAPQNALLASGAARLFIDIDTGNAAVPQLELALAELQRGDALIGLSVHTLARTVDGLLRVHAQVEARGASLRVLQMPGGLSLDTGAAEGRAILGALALMVGMSGPSATSSARATLPAAPVESDAALKARSRGRPATAGNQAHEVTRLHDQGLRAVDIAATLGIGRASVYRILSQGGADAAPASTGDARSASRGVSIAAATNGRFDPFSGR